MSDLSAKFGIPQIKMNVTVFFLRRMILGLLGVAGLLWFVGRIEYINSQRGIESSKATGLSSIARESAYVPMLYKRQATQFRLAQAPSTGQDVLIARTVSVRVSVRNFSGSRESMDRIVKTFNGYIADMTVSSPKDASQSLSADIEIPTAQSDVALQELKNLGRVEEEGQSSEAVTAQSEDLDIRLKNSREAEGRLNEILRMRTDKVADILEVEKEMARVREEIERMEAERKKLSNRIAFASIDLNLTEEYQAQIGGGRSTLWLQVRNALVNGYHGAVDGLVSVLVLLLSVGPSLVVWGAILFWPARWAWRRWQKSHAGVTAEA